MNKKDYHKEYYQKHKERLSKLNKEYAEAHKSEIQAYRRKYRDNNKAMIKDRDKQYWVDNKEERQQYNKKYYSLHREKILKRVYVYQQENPHIGLKSFIKCMNRLGESFDMSTQKYNYARTNWSKIIKKRDNICQICGSKDNLKAHHLLYKASNPKLSLNLYNGITLCEDHHNELHYGKTP